MFIICKDSKRQELRQMKTLFFEPDYAEPLQYRVSKYSEKFPKMGNISWLLLYFDCGDVYIIVHARS